MKNTELYMKLFVAHKMTRYVTLSQRLNYRRCCRRIRICLERQPHKVAVNWKKINCWELSGAAVPHCLR